MKVASVMIYAHVPAQAGDGLSTVSGRKPLLPAGTIMPSENSARRPDAAQVGHRR